MPKPCNIVRGQKINPQKLKRAKEMRRNMTPAERKLWAALRRNQLDGLHFRRQQIIDGFIVDFYCHAAGLVIEIDGPIHGKPEQAEYDAERDRILAARGLHLLRVRNEDVIQNLEEVLECIRDARHAGGDLTPQPPPLTGKGEEDSPPLTGKGEEDSPPLTGKGEEDSPPLTGEGPGEGSS
jgi:very-short-patch-repair endonuclease